MIKNFIKINLSVNLILIFSLSFNCFANISLIRDSQSEEFLHKLSNPLLKAAKLNPKNINFYIVNDNSINAFVTGGQNIFVNTGLIRKYKTPDSLIGVMAHEIGHISGGHLARSKDGTTGANAALLLSYLLGIGAAAAGAPDAAMGIILGGSQTAQRLYMRYTRGQEEAADQYAIKYLDEIGYPADGLIKLFEYLDSKSIGYRGYIDEYASSHPLSKKRIDVIKYRANKSHSNKKINRALQQDMDIILAKLEGFLDDPTKILIKHSNKHDALSNYSKAIAYYRTGYIKRAIKLLDKVILAYPKDGYMLETKGQIYFESGDIDNAILSYNKALKLINPKYSAPIKVAFAGAILSLKTNDNDLNNLAIKHLNEAKLLEQNNPSIYYNLAKAYAKNNDDGMSFLSLAWYNCLLGKKSKCQKYASKAKNILNKDKNKQELLLLEDLIKTVKDLEENLEKKKKS